MSKREWLDRHFKQIARLYPGLKNIYGPTLSEKDGRLRIGLNCGIKNYNLQYCRIKMEVKLKRRLEYNETVDHDDGNKTNDKYSNLVLRDRSVHAKLDVKRRDYKSTGTCKWCNKEFELTRNQLLEDGRKKTKAGPFCSRSCTGKYGASVQNGGKALDRKKTKVVYYTNKERR